MNNSNFSNAFIPSVLLIAAIHVISSCSKNNKQHSAAGKTSEAMIAPQVTLLAELPDSNKPVVTFLENVPKPITIHSSKPPVVQSFIDPFTKMPLPPETQGMGLFTNFTTDQGLLQETVNTAIMDRNGNLWFGTGAGVSRYDGKKFTNYTTAQGLTSNSVKAIKEDGLGNIWIGTLGGGVNRYDGKKFTNYTTREGLCGNSIESIMQDKTGDIWFGSKEGGVSRYDGKKFTNYTTREGLANDEVQSITEDKDGNIWFGTIGGGVSRYDGKKFINYTTSDGLAHNAAYSSTVDKSGNIWFGTIGGGVSCFDGKKFTNYSTAEGLADNIVLCISEDKEGNLWFGTGVGGVSRYDGEKFTNFTTSQGLAYNTIANITEDKMGNLWFGTDGGGVSLYEGKSLTRFISAPGRMMNSIFSITKDKTGKLWFGVLEGIGFYDGKGFTTYSAAQGFTSNGVMGITEDKKGNLWFGTDLGLCFFDGKGFTYYTTAQGLPNNIVLNITEDKEGNLWLGTANGVSCYNGKSFTNYTTTQDLADNFVRTITEDRTGVLWMGTANGVSVFDGRSFTSYTTAQGLAHNIVLNITEDKEGNLWIGTEGGGLSRYDGKSFTSFNMSHGLPDNVVTSVVVDSSGNIMMGTNFGFGVLTSFTAKSTATRPGTAVPAQNSLSNDELANYIPQIEIYNSSTGYPVKDVNFGQNAMYQDNDGIVWIGTGADKTGLVRFDYDAIRKRNDPPLVRLQNVRINNENICWYNLLPASRREELKPDSNSTAPHIVEEVTTLGKVLNEADRDSIRSKFGAIQFDSITRFYPIPINLVLPYNHNNVTFDFAAIEPGRPQLVKYQYFLEGYDKDWSPVTSQSLATYGNMREGTYTFRLKAQSPFGVWSEPITYTFKVLPPWWRTWWFRILMGITFLLLLYGIYRWRTATLHKQKRILEQTVQQRTAEVVKEKAEVVRQKEKSDELLLNILPSAVAEELKEKGHTTARSYDEVTVLFSDIKGFTLVAEKMNAQELVKEINTYFSAFDGIMQNYGLEKIKTIGDAYIAAGGLPEKNAATAQNVVEAAIAMQQTVEKLKQERVSSGKPYFELRIGIHTGPVVAGVVGIKKFQYDIWGDTVNLAARMEQSGMPGKINISQHTYELVKDHFTCRHRGKIDAKNKGEVDMYFVE